MTTGAQAYTSDGGYPAAGTVQRAHDDADLNRAIAAYRFFYPTVSGYAIFKATVAAGVVPNHVSGTIDTKPRHAGYPLNPDTPYSPVTLDLRDGPMAIELPSGPLICVLVDLNQRWVADMGLPGPDAGNGGRHLVVPPLWDGEVPGGCHLARSTTYRLIGGVRSLPADGNVRAATELITRITINPLDPPDGGAAWADMGDKPMDTPGWETTLQYWHALHEIIDAEPHLDRYDALHGELAALGIVRGKPFTPDERMTQILQDAARAANGQLRVQSFAGRRQDRLVWPGRRWEWAALRYENGDFEADGYLGTQASPAMFRRMVGAGSLYWLGLRDCAGNYLDGGRAYTLTVPQPVPGRLFWSITVYEAQPRGQLQAGQNPAALRSLFELKDADPRSPVTLYFGPDPPPAAGAAARWVKTVPGTGWFAYFRIYAPAEPAFDGSWQLPDFEPGGLPSWPVRRGRC